MEQCTYHPENYAMGSCGSCHRQVCEQEIWNYDNLKMDDEILCILCHTYDEYQNLHKYVGKGEYSQGFKIAALAGTIVSIATLLYWLTRDFTSEQNKPLFIFVMGLVFLYTLIFWASIIVGEKRLKQAKQQREKFVRTISEEIREKLNITADMESLANIEDKREKRMMETIKETREKYEKTEEISYVTIKLDGRTKQVLPCCHQSARLADKICACGRKVDTELIRHFASA